MLAKTAKSTINAAKSRAISPHLAPKSDEFKPTFKLDSFGHTKNVENAGKNGVLGRELFVQIKRTFNLDNRALSYIHIYSANHTRINSAEHAKTAAQRALLTAYPVDSTRVTKNNLPAPPNSARPAAPPLFGPAALRHPAARTRTYSRTSGPGCARRAGRPFFKQKSLTKEPYHESKGY